MKMNKKREKRESVLHLGTHCDEREASCRQINDVSPLKQLRALESKNPTCLKFLSRVSHFACKDASRTPCENEFQQVSRSVGRCKNLPES